ncbi:MAG TPA: hypothetical protein GX005_00365 [Bacteroidales bacterium]|nr:hypothetical protein [Bacteroidales bacterium]
MKKVLVHARQGFTSVGLMNTEKAVELVGIKTIFKEGNANSTIGNIMYATGQMIEMFLEAEAETDETLAIAMPSVVADKLNSDIFLKEHLSGKLVGKNGRRLSDSEKQIYAYLARTIGASYGRVLIVSQQYISKNTETAKNANQKEWAALFNTVKGTVDFHFAEQNMPVASGELPLPF